MFSDTRCRFRWHETGKDNKKHARPRGCHQKSATAKCRDNTYSFSQHRRGARSRQGGVMAWL
ncbi:DUF3761 domain-containing protein [Pseudomonas frederiksbergensis]|uniref:DUF3761 domain-containing protein n=1 Tax=Pseudomonas frederiksbergensis TaxID=104087 RepID=UPI0009D6E5E7|nr:DUF3761 domain-containing protein [Pseudomonas frederiksbergensis]